MVSHQVSEISSISQPTLSQVEQLKKKCAESNEVRKLIGAFPSIDIERLIQDKGGEEWAGKVNSQLNLTIEAELKGRRFDNHGFFNPGRVFYNAVKNKHIELVQFLISAHGPALASGLYMKDGGDILQVKNMTVLMLAAENDNPLMLETLLSTNISSEFLNQCDCAGHSALRHAVEKGNLTNMNVLLRAGGNLVNMEEALLKEIDKPGNFELLIKGGGVPSVDNSKVIDALFKRINVFTKRIVDHNIKDVRLIEPVLLLAAEHGFIDVIMTLCNTKDAVFSDDKKNEALMLAARYGHVDVVKTLINAGFGNDIENILLTAIKYCPAKEDKLKIVNILLNASKKLSPPTDLSPFVIHAAEYGDVEVMNLLLEKQPKLLSNSEFVFQALLYAIYAGHLNFVKALFEKIAVNKTEPQVYKRIKEKMPELFLIAAKNGHLEIVNFIANTKEFMISQKVKDDALIFGVGQIDVVNFLLQSGAQVTRQPIEDAVYLRNKEVLKELLKTGYKVDEKMIEIAKKMQDDEMVKLLQEAQASGRVEAPEGRLKPGGRHTPIVSREAATEETSMNRSSPENLT